MMHGNTSASAKIGACPKFDDALDQRSLGEMLPQPSP